MIKRYQFSRFFSSLILIIVTCTSLNCFDNNIKSHEKIALIGNVYFFTNTKPSEDKLMIKIPFFYKFNFNTRIYDALKSSHNAVKN